MKIFLIGNYPLDEQESMRRYTALLTSGLRERGHDITVLAPTPLLGRISASVFWRKWLGYIDKFVLFPWRLRRRVRSADLVHICDHSNAMYVRSVRDKPHVITCHDVLAVRSALHHFPENPVSRTGRLLQRWITNGLRAAQCIVCISENTCNELHALLSIPSERLRVIPLALHWPFTPAPQAEREADLRRLGVPLDRPYFLHVGANHWYKNRSAVLRIFRALREHDAYRRAVLVLAGPPWPAEFHAFLSIHQLTGAAIALRGVSDLDLRALYSGAASFIFPSRYEGFGWPILEAQACGCPVATVDRPPMNTVAGTAAIYIDPDDPASAAAAIAAGLANRATLRAAGIANLARFDRETMLDSYVATYREICSASTTTRQRATGVVS